MGRYAYRKRMFLMPISSGTSSYIFAEVHSSFGGEYDSGSNIITLADCHRTVELEFFLGNYIDRKQSLAKIVQLLKVLTGFRDALQREAKLIANHKEPPRRGPTNKQTHESPKI